MSMKVISIINLKGGVGKTISSVNIAHILSTIHNKKVLIVDNDKQGNTSRLFGVKDATKSIADIMVESCINVKTVIKQTRYKDLDIIPANMDLLEANISVITDDEIEEKAAILKDALDQVKSEYDYCIIDNPPDINLSVINALVASNDVLIPIRIDQFALDGMKELIEQINNVETAKLKGCFITQFSKNKMNLSKLEELRNNSKYPILDTVIRRTVKVEESTFENLPLLEFSKRCNASRDYVDLVEEYLKL
ncbi:ParA family protein [Clostridium beijerinckii]|uniref:ParA family protein n=1 Tax=Clostridium beijerinckii TaxID=1520 RepID=UPI0003D38B91|nr:ParA family protein [Clostridium beijerinckii]